MTRVFATCGIEEQKNSPFARLLERLSERVKKS